MSLKTNIEKEIKQAMLAKQKDRLRGLRAIKSMIMLEETKAGSETGLSDAEELQILTKAAKQRRDSIEIFEKQGRKDLASLELTELEVISEFLPKQLSDEELTAELEAIISESGASKSEISFKPLRQN